MQDVSSENTMVIIILYVLPFGDSLVLCVTGVWPPEEQRVAGRELPDGGEPGQQYYRRVGGDSHGWQLGDKVGAEL